jgi:hypothetical protein
MGSTGEGVRARQGLLPFAPPFPASIRPVSKDTGLIDKGRPGKRDEDAYRWTGGTFIPQPGLPEHMRATGAAHRPLVISRRFDSAAGCRKEPGAGSPGGCE